MNKILVTGGNGQLGRALKDVFGNKAEYISHQELDISHIESVTQVISKQPRLLIHAGAMTDVDKCERDHDSAYQTNALGAQYMALACRELGIPLIYISTDYVFDGKKGAPYLESDFPNPINYYGRTKYDGEKLVKEILKNHFIIRPGWLYGQGEHNFVYKVIKQVKEGKPLTMSGNIGSPTYAKDFALALSQFAETDAYGVYHLSNDGYCSRFDWAKKICEIIGKPDYLISRGDFRPYAPRPKDTSLCNTLARDNLGIVLPRWEAALESFIKTFHL